MHPLIADNLDQIRRLCEEFGVERLEVFGSINTPDFDPDRSDVDFLVTYPENYEYGPWMGRYFRLKELLAALLERDVDLVINTTFDNRYFVRALNASRKELYAA